MKELILRNTPDIADAFEMRECDSVNGSDHYEVFCENDKIVICGNCKISQAMGYYAYLRKYCGVNLSRCGNRRINVLSAPLFDGKIQKTVKQKKRACMSYEALGYSCAFWQWEDWEREIDFMAMNGVNLPLSVVGSEAVWYYTMRSLTYSETGALEYLSGPAFWPWQLTGCLVGYFSLTDVKYIESRLELGKKIIERELELGMTPVQQAFAGYVPQSITKLFGSAKLRMVPSWRNFPFSFRLEPTDPVFKKLAFAFLEKQRQLFGAHHYYACDLFNETEPLPKNIKNDRLWKIGRAFDTILKDFDPESVWVMRSSSVREQVVRSVPHGRLLIIDSDSSMHGETEEFWGHDFILGTVHSHGDRNSLHGDIRALAANPYSLVNAENCCGTGIFTEGLNQNPLYYDLAFEMLTESEAIDLDKWLADYAYRRYGSREKCLADAAALLAESCYGASPDGKEPGSVICSRPATDLRHSAPGDTLEPYYSNKTLFAAAEALLGSSSASKDGYVYDVCDITRQVLSNHAAALYRRAMYGFNNKDVNAFERSSNSFLKVCCELDELLQTVPELTLHEHLKEASAAAVSDKDKQNFELNLLTQITLWGPINNTVNYDYACKEWGGLIGTYYVKRWQSFFERLAYEFPRRGSRFSTTTRKQVDERNIYRGSQFYKNYADFEKKWLSTTNPEPPTDADTLKLAAELLAKYKKAIFEE